MTTIPKMDPHYFFRFVNHASYIEKDDHEYKVFNKCIACLSPRDSTDQQTIISHRHQLQHWFCKTCAALWRINLGIEWHDMNQEYESHIPDLVKENHIDSRKSIKERERINKLIEKKQKEEKMCQIYARKNK
jgi:hypothetical protein